MADNKHKIIFMGTPQFAADILDYLYNSGNVEISAVYTMPDAIRGRGKKMVPSPVKLKAQDLGLKVFTPVNFKDQTDVDQVVSFNADFICVAAYGVIVPASVLDSPKYCCLNVHGSLLPKWRGAAPIQRAILAGDEKIGYSIMKMDIGMDTGDYSFQNSIDSADKSLSDIYNWMAKDGASALISVMDACVNDTISWIKQDNEQATNANKIQKHELWYDEDDSVDLTYRKILASSPEAPFKCKIAGRNVTIVSAKKTDNEISIETIKPDGKNEMPWKSFLAGVQNSKNASLEWSACE